MGQSQSCSPQGKEPRLCVRLPRLPCLGRCTFPGTLAPVFTGSLRTTPGKAAENTPRAAVHTGDRSPTGHQSPLLPVLEARPPALPAPSHGAGVNAELPIGQHPSWMPSEHLTSAVPSSYPLRASPSASPWAETCGCPLALSSPGRASAITVNSPRENFSVPHP